MNTLNEINQKIGKYRWTICSLLFFATTINYLDRQVLSLLKDRLEVEFNWTDTDYANIVMVFQLVYAVSMLFAGRIIDWLGTKSGFAWSLIVWSIGAIFHAFARGTGGFMFARAVLGFGEAGNFPAAIKTTAEWFPKKERALATGIFNSGANVGAILAPITVPWLAKHWGWQAAFVIVGAIGFLWLIFWFWFYELPSKQKRLGKAEFDHIHSDKDDQPAPTADGPKLPWFEEWSRLLGYRQTWAFAFGKFMTDGVWWFFLFWLPAFLKAQYHMTGTDVAVPLAVLYSMTCVGSVCGGWFPMYFINKGYDPYAGRMRAMFIIALFPVVVLLAQPLGHLSVFGSYSYWIPVLLIGVGASAHQAWSANIFTTVSDMFPKKSVASVTGIGGMCGGIGGIFVNKIGGWLFDAFRSAGIAKTWAEAKAVDLGGYLDQILAMNLTNKHGTPIDLNRAELGGLPEQVTSQIQSINPQAFAQLKQMQLTIVQGEMKNAYVFMFAFCALAYVIAWLVMKFLVPKYKKIENL